MALTGITRTICRRQPQPDARVRINPNHWLADDLLFAHTGRHAFLRHEPAKPLAQPWMPYHRGDRNQAATFEAFGRSENFSATGTDFLEFDTGGHSSIVTLAAWVVRGGTTTDSMSGISSSSDNAGYFLLRINASPYAINALSITSAGTVNQANTAAATVADVWAHGIAVRAGNTDRRSFFNGANKGTSTASSNPGAVHNRIILMGARRSGNTAVAGAQLTGLAIPLAINRALSDDEVAGLYQEQLINPWALFMEAPIWVPVSSGSALPTLTAISASNISATGATLTITAS